MAKWIKPNITDGGLAQPEHTTPGMGGGTTPDAKSGAESAGLHVPAKQTMTNVRSEKMYGTKGVYRMKG